MSPSSKKEIKQQVAGRELPQLWFFLLETMSTTMLSQGTYTVDEIKEMNLSLCECLKLSNARGNVEDHNF
jgi:hypothetical protein